MSQAVLKTSLYRLSIAELTEKLPQWGEKKFRAKQVALWLYEKHVQNYADMRNLPQSLRDKLAENYPLTVSSVAGEVVAVDGTTKLLLELLDGELIEMVIIPSPERMTFCLSTQVGCPVRCRFCASGQNGLTRNLRADEILDEFLHGVRKIGRLPDNIVFMGIGEGLLNFDELALALERLTGAEYFGMSPRRLTVSTSGYVPGMKQLADLGKEFTLAISLHAADEETRSRLIPDFVRYPIAEILAMADYYLQKTGRMVTFEYTLLANENDSEAAALALAQLARKHHAKINVIPYNETAVGFQRPSDAVIRRFAQHLEEAGAHVTVRLEKGAKVAAACGQLRAQHQS